jgi:hypothetical protein
MTIILSLADFKSFKSIEEIWNMTKKLFYFRRSYLMYSSCLSVFSLTVRFYYIERMRWISLYPSLTFPLFSKIL